MLDTTKYILKPKSFMIWIVLFILIIWTYAYYSLTGFEEILSEPRAFVMEHGKC